MSWQTELKPIVENIRDHYAVTGMVIARLRAGGPLETLVSGTDAKGNLLSDNSLFPVASITKLATALVILRLADAGALKLDDLLSNYLPEAAAAQEGVTLRRLLCHTGGLPEDIAPGLAPYTEDLCWSELAQGCMVTPLVMKPHTQVRYSNVGPGLLAIVVERLTRQTFQEVMNQLVLTPLQIDGYLGREPARAPAAIAGRLGTKAGTSLEPYNTAFWRSLGLPWGGLVTDARGALALVRAYAGIPTGFLSRQALFEATHDQTSGLSGGFFQPLWWPRSPWGLGAELRGDKNPHWTPEQASSESFGHAGASGCLVWHDPVADLSWVIMGACTFETWWTQWHKIGAAILLG